MKKSVFIGSALFLSLVATSFTACGDDDSASPRNEDEVVDILDSIIKKDSVFFKDSVIFGDSLYSWYLKNLAREDGKTDSSKVDVPAGGSGNESAGPEEEDDEPVSTEAQLLPPAGFYSAFTMPVPAAKQGGTIRCSFDGSPVTAESDKLEEPLEISKTMVVRCGEFVKDVAVRLSTQSYFIEEDIKMPVVSISVDPAFFDTVYVNTDRCEGDDPYRCPGLMRETENLIHMEFFEKGSRSSGKAWEVDAGISLMGNYSRTYPKKPVGIKIKKEYNEKKLKYSMFSARPEVNKFRGFNLRNSGNRYVGDYIGDPSMTAIVEGSSVDYQRSRQVVVFYNGEYYGIHDLRERINEHFVETNYGIDNNSVEMIKHKKDSVTVTAGTGEAYKTMLAFIAENDFSGANNEAYEKVKEMMDVGNYADYIAAQFYLQNADWPSNNVRAWRSPEQPFKFVLFDTDQGLGWKWVSLDFQYNTKGMFGWMKNDRGEGRTSPGYFANIYKQLSVNPDFRRMFVNHGAVMMNEYLTYDRLAASVAAQNAQIPDEEITRDMVKFPRRYCGFYDQLGCGFDRRGDYILMNARGRTEGLREEYRTEFELGADITVTVAANGSGYVTIDDMKLPRTSYKGTFFLGNDMLLKAVPVAGATFVKWKDGSTDNPRLVSPEDGSSYEAIFK